MDPDIGNRYNAGKNNTQMEIRKQEAWGSLSWLLPAQARSSLRTESRDEIVRPHEDALGNWMPRNSALESWMKR